MAEQQESRRNLVVVDDDRGFRHLVARVAGPIGWMVTEFDNGGTFLAAIGLGLRPDLTILDIVMPNVDGIETIGALGSSKVRCPVVLITGRLPLYTSAARELGRAHGLEIVNVLQKPIALARLRETLALPATPG
jgi:FixJ family two-component response regulator